MRSAAAQAESPFEVEVAQALVARHYPIQQQFAVGSYRIDIAIIEDERRIAVECDGERWHSGEQKLLEDLERQTVLERLGWRFIRIRGSRYYANKKAALDDVFAQLDDLGIEPREIEVTDEKRLELLDRVLAAMNGGDDGDGGGDPDGPDGPDGGSGVGFDANPTDLLGTRLREATIAAALDDRSLAPGRVTQRSAVEQAAAASSPVAADAPRFSRETPRKVAYEVTSLQEMTIDGSSDYGMGQSRSLVRSHMEQVIKCEAPIEESVLFKRVADSFGIGRIGSDLKDRSRRVLKDVRCQRATFQGHTYLWGPEDKPAEYCSFRCGGPRDIESYAAEELVAVLRYALRGKSRGLQRSDLFKIARQELGFHRTGAKIEVALTAALDLARKDGAIVDNGGWCWLS